MAEGFATVKERHHLFIVLVLSFLIWLETALGIYLIARAFGYPVLYAESVFVLLILLLAVMLPSSPGYLGTFDAGMAYGLMIFNIPREAALGMTVLYHGLSMVPVILLGLYYLWKYNIKLRE